MALRIDTFALVAECFEPSIEVDKRLTADQMSPVDPVGRNIVRRAKGTHWLFGDTKPQVALRTSNAMHEQVITMKGSGIDELVGRTI